MADLILHHHDPSPFAEKIRLVFGLKGLSWSSVQLPMVMPRPALMPLTGGYRKVPVLQAGADVYCDTRLIARELERRHPEPSLFPGGSAGLAMALGAWSDRSFFDPGAGLSMGLNKSLIPTEVIEDRKGFFNFMDFDRLEQDIPHLYTQLRANLVLVESMLEDGRAYLLGDRPGWADINAYFPVWMARGNIGDAARLLEPFAALRAWEQRMQEIGNGRRSEMDATDALEVARKAEPLPPAGVLADDPLGLAAGARVSVTPDDYGRIPVEGELVTLNDSEVAIRRHTTETGDVIVHFPRAGYRIIEAA
ncbi:MAG: glutathione S-transferase family protein [Steroidobacteraceae bacterium]